MPKKKRESFEELLKRLDEISQLLESEEVGLEESIKLYEEGIKLSEKCYSILKEAELKVTELKTRFDESVNKNLE